MIHIANNKGKLSTYKYRLGAVIVKSGNVVSFGYNRVGHRAKGIHNPILESSIHAERDAISKLLKPKHYHKLQGAKIYISRINNKGITRMAKPCNQCMNLIKSCGIKEIIYTTNLGIVKEKV